MGPSINEECLGENPRVHMNVSSLREKVDPMPKGALDYQYPVVTTQLSDTIHTSTRPVIEQQTEENIHKEKILAGRLTVQLQ
jgi:hypothetical protein